MKTSFTEEQITLFIESCDILKITVLSFIDDDNSCAIKELSEIIGCVNRLCKVKLERYRAVITKHRDKSKYFGYVQEAKLDLIKQVSNI